MKMNYTNKVIGNILGKKPKKDKRSRNYYVGQSYISDDEYDYLDDNPEEAEQFLFGKNKKTKK